MSGSTWGGAWGACWGDAWGGDEPLPQIISAGGDAERARMRRLRDDDETLLLLFAAFVAVPAR